MTTIEEAITKAAQHVEPLDRVEALGLVARHVDRTRSDVARMRCIAAAKAADTYTHREIAERCGVTPGMVQQWVKRGREYIRMDDPF